MKFKMFFLQQYRNDVSYYETKGGVGFDRSGSSIRFKVIFT